MLTRIRPGKSYRDPSTWPTLPGPFSDIDAIEERNRRAGQHFFDRQSMRFFSSRILPTVYAGRVFVTSERDKYRDENPRLYTLRAARDDGSIATVGPFQCYPTRRAAVRAAEKIERLAAVIA